MKNRIVYLALKRGAILLMFCAVSIRAPSASIELECDKYHVLEMAARQMQCNSLAFRNRNPGNLTDFRTGKNRKFKTFAKGVAALRTQIELYKSGQSLWTDTATTLGQFSAIYEPVGTKYIIGLCGLLRLPNTTKISSINTDSIMWAVIRLEDASVSKLFKENKIF